MTPKKWYECSFKALYVLKTFLQLVRLLFMNIWKSHSYKFMLRCSKIKPLKLWQNEKRWTLRISKTFFGFWVETYGLYKNTRIYLKSMSWKKKANVPPSNRPVPLQCSVSNAARRYCRKFNRFHCLRRKVYYCQMFLCLSPNKNNIRCNWEKLEMCLWVFASSNVLMFYMIRMICLFHACWNISFTTFFFFL